MNYQRRADRDDDGTADDIDGPAYWTRQAAAMKPVSTTPPVVRIAAEWTPETTSARREAWNNAIRSGKYTSKNGRDLDVTTMQQHFGFTFGDLKAAIKHHGL